MSVLIDVEGESFRVDTRRRFGRVRSVDFAWLNGPADGAYGFSMGPTFGFTVGLSGWIHRRTKSEKVLSRAELEREAHNFVRAFFETGGIGQTDFPEFVESRRASRQ